MRNSFFAWLPIVLLLITIPRLISAQDSPAKPKCDVELAKQILDEVPRVHEESGFSGAILVAENGKIILAQAIGTSNDDARTPLTVSSLFEIASVTKSFTGVAAVLLHQQGKLDLDTFHPADRTQPSKLPGAGRQRVVSSVNLRMGAFSFLTATKTISSHSNTATSE